MTRPEVACSASPLGRQAARLTRLYIVALSAVALLSLTGQLLVQQSLQRQWSDSTVVNLAGRQRMLSQKLTKAALVWQRSTSETERLAAGQEIQQTLDLWKRTHQGLQSGDPELKLPGNLSSSVTQQFSALQPTFDAMVQAAESLGDSLSADDDQAVMELLERESHFLEAMNTVVFQLDAEARARVATLRFIEWGLFAVTLLVLVVEGTLVFRPAVQRIHEAADALMRSREELRIAKEAAESASEQKSRFLATISHELRNPLHAMLGNAELATNIAQTDKQRELLRTISASGQSLRALVDDLLDLACIQAGRLRVQQAPFDLRAAAQQTVEMLRPDAERAGLELRAEFAGEPFVVCGDRLRVQQILLNLLGNALKFTRRGSVTLTVIQTGPEQPIVLEVADTGPGIDPDEQAKIFAAFTQGKQTYEREQKGVGLGLAICQGLVELMRGQITLVSTPGVGSRFRVELPLKTASSPEHAGVPIETRSLAPRTHRILIADDDPVNLKLLAEFLQTLGHETVLATSGEEALARYQSGNIDVCLLDGNMQGLDGWELARKIRAHEAEAQICARPLIAISAASSVEPAHREESSAFNLSLVKPVSLEQLRSALETISIPRESPAANGSLAADRWSKPLARMQGKKALFSAVAEALLAALPEELETLNRFAAEQDFVQLACTAHLLKGQLATFDEEPLVCTAGQLERAARDRDSQACERLAKALTADASRFANLLQAAIDK